MLLLALEGVCTTKRKRSTRSTKRSYKARISCASCALTCAFCVQFCSVVQSPLQGILHAQSSTDINFSSTLGELREASFPDKEKIVERLSQSGHPSVRAVLTA